MNSPSRSIVVVILAAGSMAMQACRTTKASSTLAEGETGNSEQVANVSSASTYQGPPPIVPRAENDQKWRQFCSGDDITEQVMPNYANADMKQTAKVLSIVSNFSYYFYRDLTRMYVGEYEHDRATMKFTVDMPAEAQSLGVTDEAHIFLTLLCGQFRDRASMVEAKLRWIQNFHYLANASERGKSCKSLNNPLQSGGALQEWEPYGNPWQQMCAEDYQPYLNLSRSVFNARQNRAPTHTVGSITGIDGATTGWLMCETKYQFANYIKKDRTFGFGQNAYDEYLQGFEEFKAGCSEEDLGYYYDFRGDSNFKPNSPESNAMIWASRAVVAMCDWRTKKARNGMPIGDAECREYLENPFVYRYAAARASLSPLLMHQRSHESVFRQTDFRFVTTVMQQANNENNIFGTAGPFRYRIDDTWDQSSPFFHKVTEPGTYGALVEGFDWNAPDLGISNAGGSGAPAREFVFNRIKNALDRHTDWYRYGWDSAPGLPTGSRSRKMRARDFSPFVASSYEMDQSDNFTGCGFTIPCDGKPDGYTKHKHWMFIFKVKKENWITPGDIEAGRQLDFDRHWFDETSFGDTELANTERGWDRLGTALESEYSDVVYLYNLKNPRAN